MMAFGIRPLATGLARRRDPERNHSAAEVRSEYFYRPPVQSVSCRPHVVSRTNRGYYSLGHRSPHEPSRDFFPSLDNDTLDDFGTGKGELTFSRG